MVAKKLFLGVLCFLVLSLGLVFAAHVIHLAGGASSITEVTILEDTYTLINITVNNTDAGQLANITQVNITLPSTFTLLLNGTDSAFVSYSATSTVLSWENATDYLINGSAVQYFWVNVSCDTPGNYNITVITSNATYVSTSNLSVTVNDTTVPGLVYNSGTTSAGNSTAGNVFVNVTASDNINTDMITIYLRNSTNDVINQTNSTPQATELSFNITDLSDGKYSFNATVNDTSGNMNSSSIRVYNVDTTKPLVNFSDPFANGANSSLNEIFVNVSVFTEINFNSVVYYLYNSSGLLNSTMYETRVYDINWTGLNDEMYYVNVTVNDSAGNSNSTVTLNRRVDATGPVTAFVTPSDIHTNYSRSNIFVNLSISDSRLIDAFNLTLHNSTQDPINTTGISSNSDTSTYLSFNITDLSDGIYYYNASGNDSLANVNVTATLTVTLDTDLPNVTIDESLSPADALTTGASAFNFTFNVSDKTNISTCYLVVDGEIVGVSRLTSPNQGGINGIYASGFSIATHTWYINCTDYCGNTGNSSSRTLTISGVTGDPGSSGGGGGGGGGASTYSPSESELAAGYKKALSSGDKVIFSANDGSHTMTLSSVSTNAATIIVASTPQTATLGVGDSKKFEVDSDGYYDLSVVVNSIVSGKSANVTVKSVNEKITGKDKKAAATQDTEEQTPPGQAKKEPQLSPQAASISAGMIATVIIIVLVIAGIVGAVVYRAKHSVRLPKFRG
ncbi:MAG: hypothetical protein ABIE22_05205 [archaeon]